MTAGGGSGNLDQYAALVGDQVIARIRGKAGPLAGSSVVHVTSKSSEGGISAILSSLTSLMGEVGIAAEWRVINGTPEFSEAARQCEKALLAPEINVDVEERHIQEPTTQENAIRLELKHDLVVVHDLQSLPLINYYRKRPPWVWHCHADPSSPAWTFFDRLRPIIESYDAIILRLESYRQAVRTLQLFFPPAIDPFGPTNRDLSDEEIQARLAEYGIPDDLPILTQVGRFDRWKNPESAIRVFELVQRKVPCTLVLVGTSPGDSPKDRELYDSLLTCQDERIRIISSRDCDLVNALQRRAEVVLQMSRREGFGLAITEALWKGAGVVARRVGGLHLQVCDGKTGFLVDSDEPAAEGVIALLRDERLRKTFGEEAHRSVKERFLMIRLLERYVDLLGSIEPRFVIRYA